MKQRPDPGGREDQAGAEEQIGTVNPGLTRPMPRARAKIPAGFLLRLSAFLLALVLHVTVVFMAGSGGGAALSDSSSDFVLAPAFRVLAPPPPVVVPPVEVPELDAPIIASEKENEVEEEEPEEVPEEPELAEPAELAAAENPDEGSTSEQAGRQDSGSTSSGGSGAGSGLGTGEGRSFWPVYKVDVRPEMISEAELVYPEAARRQNREGSVIVELDITEDGLVEAAKVVRSAGYGFDEAAVAMLSASRFAPAQAGGRSVPVRARFTINFRLKD
ncbi:MAG: energy transducer TonB [Spirochaetes bacterium]|nr:energy transducer TonB [Spirochaetota bacterium]MBU0953847.1 energy transducer TonB [Spirochaetota bacterium]